ncbi:MAG: SDR family oxidoreductase [Spirochaetes bacterium]|nr:SDR family oxidoreductase [Spirochaetota bacterium]MBU1081897.1 SDR family oxidoreductase [Spirochaetota bacterium]
MQSLIKYALVTGASGGIGREFALRLASEGWAIVLVGRNEAKLLAVKAALSGANAAASEVVVCDLSVPGAAERLHATCAGKGLAVELLVNNAGSGVFGESLESSPAGVEAMVNLNVSALTILCALFGREMKARGSGRVLNVGSFAGLNATPYFAAYAATKSYVLNYTLALRAELRGSGVVVTCLLPGYVRTDFDDNAGVKSAAYKRFSSANGLGPEEVAAVGLAALEDGKAFAIAGARNRIAAFLFGLLPRTAPPAIMKSFLDRLV